MSAITVTNPEKFRSNIREKINVILNNDKNSSNLEKGIFNYALKEATSKKIVKKWDNHHFVQIYVDRFRSIFINLKNKDIIENINSGNIKPHVVAFMTHQELNPERWQTLIDAKSKRDKNKFEANLVASTDMFQCRKCKGKECTYYLLQLRSADEPMTVFVQCITCGNKWKTS